MTAVLFIAVLFFLILVHELGHFLTAKWAKMRVDEFAIGFPPRLFSIKKGETEYAINLLPIGGYVKILGENGEPEAMGMDARTRAFGARPRVQQAIVLLAGITMNILAAWVIFIAVALIGTPTAISEVEHAATGHGVLTVTGLIPGSPAATAEVPPGAVITDVAADNAQLEDLTPSGLTAFVNAHQDQIIVLQYEHKGAAGVASIQPTAGVLADDPERPAIGLASSIVEVRREGPLSAILIGTERTYESLSAITVGLVSFLGSAFTFSANIEDVTGPIGIAGMVGEAAEFGFTSLLLFTAFISLNLAVINLLPIPALDGGRLLFVIAEAVIRRPINPEWMARVNFVGFAFLILLMIIVTSHDILRFF